MAGDEIEKGDKVSWAWGSGQPAGKVVEKAKEGELSIKSHRGNTIKKNADPSNPAVHIGRSGNDVVKRASELEVEEKNKKSSKPSKSPAPPSKDKEKDGESGGAVKKREHKDDNKDGKEPDEKKQKKNAGDTKGKAEANGEKKGPGRSKGGSAGASKKQKASKPRATEGVSSRTRSRA